MAGTESVKIFEKIEDEDKVKPTVEDGEKVTLKCSECDKPLVVIHRTRPNERRKNNKPLKWKIKAKCCYCGDFSFSKVIEGGFHHHGYHEPHPNGNVEDVIPFVNVTNIETEGENVIFNTEKVQ